MARGKALRWLHQGTIGVLGTAHIDIVGYSRDRRENLDKIGDVKLTLGGSAYRNAVYLARVGRRVHFWTALKRDSLIEKWLLQKFRSERIDYHKVTRRRNIGIGVFLGIKHQGEHLAALTHGELDKVALPRSRVSSMISQCGAVVADCNLSSVQISDVLRISSRRNVPISIAGVSEGRVLNFVTAARNTPEAQTFGLAVDGLIFDALVRYFEEQAIETSDIVDYLNLQVLAVFEGIERTQSGNGYNAKFRFQFRDNVSEEFVQFVAGDATTTGVRDALASAVTDVSARLGPHIDDKDKFLDDLRERSWPILLMVLQGQPSNLGEIPGGASVYSFGIETEATPWRLVLYKGLRTFFASAAQLILVLLALWAAFTQAYPHRAKPLLDWITSALLGR